MHDQRFLPLISLFQNDSCKEENAHNDDKDNVKATGKGKDNDRLKYLTLFTIIPYANGNDKDDGK